MKTRTVHIVITATGEALPIWPGTPDAMKVTDVPNGVGDYELAHIITALKLRGRRLEYAAIVAEKERTDGR